jgi:hypothetical protein
MAVAVVLVARLALLEVLVVAGLLLLQHLGQVVQELQVKALLAEIILLVALT